jgi:hypothetical protein
VTNNASQASPEQAKVELAARALSLCICNRARKALGHEPVTDTGNAWKSHVDDARAVIAALSTDDERRMREALLEARKALSAVAGFPKCAPISNNALQMVDAAMTTIDAALRNKERTNEPE